MKRTSLPEREIVMKMVMNYGCCCRNCSIRWRRPGRCWRTSCSRAARSGWLARARTCTEDVAGRRPAGTRRPGSHWRKGCSTSSSETYFLCKDAVFAEQLHALCIHGGDRHWERGARLSSFAHRSTSAPPIRSTLAVLELIPSPPIC